MGAFVDRAPAWVVTLLMHNWPLLLYVPFTCWWAIRAYLHPSRPRLLLVYAGLLLVAAFEYAKHGTRVVQETTDYLLGELPSARLVSQFLFIQLLPISGHLFGFLFIFYVAINGLGGRSSQDPAEATNHIPQR
jgi:hypothetical protein